MAKTGGPPSKYKLASKNFTSKPWTPEEREIVHVTEASKLFCKYCNVYLLLFYCHGICTNFSQKPFIYRNLLQNGNWCKEKGSPETSLEWLQISSECGVTGWSELNWLICCTRGNKKDLMMRIFNIMINLPHTALPETLIIIIKPH